MRALAEAAQGKAIPLLEGGQGFAVANGPKDGLFYVGEAEGEADFATFCASLSLAENGASFPLRSWLPELQSLQAKTNAAFQPPQSIELHNRFIALNSSIKLAQELDSSRFYAGALFAYLEAVRHYGMLTAKPLDAAQQASAEAGPGRRAARSCLPHRVTSQSHSYFWNVPNLMRTPRRFALRVPTSGAAHASSSTRYCPPTMLRRSRRYAIAQASGKTVDITLVRWPYT